MTNKISNENDSAGPQKEEIESDQMNGATLYLKGKKGKSGAERTKLVTISEHEKAPQKRLDISVHPREK